MPARFSHAGAATACRPAPLFGQHTREVLAEIGFTPEQIGAFDAAGTLGRSPYNLPFEEDK
jgi:crotonobetainyl-CoA:carnitine CoA-transferase CaiB-like acyl-CoA transferase